MKHIMVDLESLGTAADAAIISIGAVRFDLESDKVDDDGFYASVSIDSNRQHGRRIQEDTLAWWMKQSPAAQAVFHEPKQPLDLALKSFSVWIDDPDCFIWANGADFDTPMLAHAYISMGMAVPWKFWNSRCFRTYKNLPGAKNVSVAGLGVKHNAMTDAYNQARTVQAIYSKLWKQTKQSQPRA